MSPISIGVLAIGMSIDALIASLGRGAQARGRPRLGAALRTGAVFGAVEAVTPVVGWALGVAAAGFVTAVDHWIAFGLLALVGGRMVMAAMGPREAEAPAAQGLLALMATALGTSIDAAAVGVSLAFLDVNIWIVALAIGLATMLMSTTGMLAGRLLGARFGRWAEGLGGLALVGLGIGIVIEHLTAA
ncbi:manganese efflux pump MntP [Frigidibacter sp. MR17.24]|uniref:manganese efflux pump MntP n=1 Tax=Frigidibacter sp. MR17.24 TaxID=3127345 RepID=UPI0030129F91